MKDFVVCYGMTETSPVSFQVAVLFTPQYIAIDKDESCKRKLGIY
jgi:diphthamide synthase subunit DPH2